MAATRWKYLVPYQDDIAAALTDLQREVIATGNYRWPDPTAGDESLGPRPQSLGELAAVRRTEAFYLQGTHSVLDVDRVEPDDAPPADGAVRGLTPEQTAAVFGAQRPTAELFEAAWQQDRLPVDRTHWAGRWLVLFEGSALAQIAFWGSSGD